MLGASSCNSKQGSQLREYYLSFEKRADLGEHPRGWLVVLVLIDYDDNV